MAVILLFIKAMRCAFFLFLHNSIHKIFTLRLGIIFYPIWFKVIHYRPGNSRWLLGWISNRMISINLFIMTISFASWVRYGMDCMFFKVHGSVIACGNWNNHFLSLCFALIQTGKRIFHHKAKACKNIRSTLSNSLRLPKFIGYILFRLLCLHWLHPVKQQSVHHFESIDRDQTWYWMVSRVHRIVFFVFLLEYPCKQRDRAAVPYQFRKLEQVYRAQWGFLRALRPDF